LEEIVKSLPAFLCAGKKQVNGGQCLVSWGCISRPLKFGGLGVKDLKFQGLALRVRYEWLKRTEPIKLWQRLNMLKDDDAIEVGQVSTSRW
jgi:hypothetical protein